MPSHLVEAPAYVSSETPQVANVLPKSLFCEPLRSPRREEAFQEVVVDPAVRLRFGLSWHRMLPAGCWFTQNDECRSPSQGNRHLPRSETYLERMTRFELATLTLAKKGCGHRPYSPSTAAQCPTVRKTVREIRLVRPVRIPVYHPVFAVQFDGRYPPMATA